MNCFLCSNSSTCWQNMDFQIMQKKISERRSYPKFQSEFNKFRPVYISQTIRYMESITEWKNIQNEISDGIVLKLFSAWFWKATFWGKSTEMEGGQNSARAVDLKNFLSGIRGGNKLANTFKPFGQEMWIKSLEAHLL